MWTIKRYINLVWNLKWIGERFTSKLLDTLIAMCAQSDSKIYLCVRFFYFNRHIDKD